MLKKILSVRWLVSPDAILLFLRISVALMMLTHGLPKAARLFGPEPIQFADILGLGPAITLGFAVFAEVVCSVLILMGLATRLAAIPLIVTMLVAVFHIHAADPFSSQEMGLHYLTAYFVLLAAGSGKYSADRLVSRSGTAETRDGAVGANA